MLEKPDISEELLKSQLLESYGIDAQRVAFLPVGNDQNSAAFDVQAEGGERYFLKVRLGDFDETSATLPKFLRNHGVGAVIAPVETRLHEVSVNAGACNLVVFPFVEGHTGFDGPLSDATGSSSAGRSARFTTRRRLLKSNRGCGARRTRRSGARWRSRC